MSSSEVHPLPTTAAGRSDSPHDSTNAALEEVTTSLSQISQVIDSLKNQIDADRCVYIKKRIEENKIKMAKSTNNHRTLSAERRNLSAIHGDNIDNLLTKRQKEAIDMRHGVDFGHVGSSSLENEHASVILLGSDIEVKNSVLPIILPKVEKLPPYTTWIFLDRNQRMTEDQSVVGRRRIYYDRNGGETLICSDSEEEVIDDEVDKKEFVGAEDHIIRMTIEQFGLSDIVVDSLAKRLDRETSEVKARYEALVSKENAMDISKYGDSDFDMNSFLDKDLETVLDSFDNLFCRRCFIFDCKLHGCSQELIFPAERQSCNEVVEVTDPCGPDCYLQAENLEGNSGTSPMELDNELATALSSDGNNGPSLRSRAKSRKTENSSSPKEASATTRRSGSKDAIVPDGDNSNQVEALLMDEGNSRNEVSDFKCWRTLEKDLFEKGIEIFGKNSCLIARNLTSPFKTCVEVYHALKGYENKSSSQGSDSTNSVDNGCKVDGDENTGLSLRQRSRLLRRRSKVRRLKYSWKPTGYHTLRKQISDKKDEPCHQFNPCGCQSNCGDDCSCLANGTCCEKYCGCPKTCKNRFRGCHCAKSQCRTRQCPCFAANRECDPDVCRHCWISCGDGTLGSPGQKGDNYECRNMKLLLRQQQRVLLGRSAVSGWGAFLKNAVAKHEYLGEYTGELISHREADKRGKIYDRENSSFLFNLNDQYVLDAYRKGDKLKFANHSPDPNCYAKVMMVAGDHRVGIYAKEKINQGDELFYDYRYEPDKAPAWAKKPGDLTFRKPGDTATSSGRAKKVA